MKTPKILVIRRDNIGDLVCTLPLIAALRQRFPQGQIDALVNSYCAPVLDGNRDLDRVFIYTKAKHRANGESLAGVYWQRLKTTFALRLTGYDYALLANVSCLPRPIRWARQIGARQIIGFSETGNPLSEQIDLGIPLPGHDRHEVERLMDLMGAFGGMPHEIPSMRLVVSSAAKRSMEAALAKQGYAGPALVGLHISARLPSQRWPVAHFVELVRLLNHTAPQPVALFWSPGSSDNPGHPGDDEKAQAIVDACRGLPVYPLRTEKLEELVAGLACLDSLICSDGGAMHVAAGLGKPIVCLFGESNAAAWHPWGVPHRVIQPDSRNVADASPARVFGEWQKLTGNPFPG